MTKKENQKSPGLRPEKKASASARSGLLAAVSLLGVSLGASDAAPLDGSALAASVKDAAAGEKLVQSVTIKFDKSRKARKQSAEPPLAPKIKPVESHQLKLIKQRKPRRP